MRKLDHSRIDRIEDVVNQLDKENLEYFKLLKESTYDKNVETLKKYLNILELEYFSKVKKNECIVALEDDSLFSRENIKKLYPQFNSKLKDFR